MIDGWFVATQSPDLSRLEKDVSNCRRPPQRAKVNAVHSKPLDKVGQAGTLLTLSEQHLLNAPAPARQRPSTVPNAGGPALRWPAPGETDALELPWVLRAVVPLVSAGNAVVLELIANWLPCLAAIVGALDHLADPAAGLRRV